ncbi:SCO family protein [Winogradskyella undariae]|uniref:SCO family protein n=1 Tax=Winogradskyella undariae TaxID=1285465 RepID=UPI0015C9BB81|nr:SCO family protein [Winogradskyella undariae]
MKKLLKRNKLTLVLLSLMFITISCNEVNKNKVKEEVEEVSRVDYLPYYNEESFTPHWLVPESEEEKSFHKIKDFKLVNQLGETVTQETFKDKIYITDFFFTSCPGICPQMTGNMFSLQEEFKEDDEILFLSHSVTPTRDSVPVLKQYAEKFGVIDHKWHLVTGAKFDIYNLGRSQYFIENDLDEPKSIDDFLHTENFLLIDKNKHIRGIYNGLNRASMQQLIIDAKALKEEG